MTKKKLVWQTPENSDHGFIGNGLARHGRICLLTVALGCPPWRASRPWVCVKPSDMGKMPMPLAPPSIGRCARSSPHKPAPLDGAPVSDTSLPQRASNFCQTTSSGRPSGPGSGAVVGRDGAGAGDTRDESDRACLAASRRPRPQSRLWRDALRSRHDRAPDCGQRAVDCLAASGRGRALREDVRPPCTRLSAAAGTWPPAGWLSPPLGIFSSR